MWLAVSRPTGVEEHVQMDIGVPQKPGRPCCFRVIISGRETGLPTPGLSSRLRWRPKTQNEPLALTVLPSDANRSEARRTTGNRSILIVPTRTGNWHSARTRRREAGCRIKHSALRTTAGAQKLESRINETTPNSRVGETLTRVGFHEPSSLD